MNIKYQLKTNKIKGISFHPIRNWLIMSTYQGEVKIVDYMLGSILQEYVVTDNECIRSVEFHASQPIFVCGGHDKNVYIYDYNQKKKTTKFEGHDDYIRTVCFHQTYPLVLSASDDQTMRIWNWQSKSHLVLLTGHTNYVMCAKFHPTKNLIVSGSLDQSIRLWDFTRLLDKMTTNNGVINQLDVELLAVCEAHEKGLNWVSFHPTQDYLFSASDDKRVKLWKYDKDSMTAQESYVGHSHNVCCVEFSKPTGLVLSNSEDCSFKAWDMNGECLDTYTKANEKQWLVITHPTFPFAAVGTDSGLIVFALRDIRTSNVLVDNSIFYVNAFDLIMRNLATNKDHVLLEDLHKPHLKIYSLLEAGKCSSIIHNTLHKHGKKNQFFIKFSESKFKEAKLILVEVDIKNNDVTKKVITGENAVFIGKSKFAVLNVGSIELTDSETSMLSIGGVAGLSNIDDIYQADVGKIIYKQGSNVVYYDLTAKKQIGFIEEFALRKLKKVIWNKSRTLCALFTNKDIFLLNKHFQRVGRVAEGTKVIDGFWTDEDYIIYSTLYHIKYCLSNADKGILKSITSLIYPSTIVGSRLYYFDGTSEINQMDLNISECLFKRSIQKADIKKVREFIKTSKTPGNTMIAYLQKRNFNNVALSLANDVMTKFQLAIKAGNLEEAYSAAETLESKDCHLKLANEALKLGWTPIIEIGYQGSESWHKLAFLHVLTGNEQALDEVAEQAQKNDDCVTDFNIALYKGDIKRRIKILSETGQLALAYKMAELHGLEEYAEAIRKGIPEIVPKIKWSKKATALLPPKPLVPNYEDASEIMNGWPLYDVDEEKAALLNLESDDEEQELGIKGPEDLQDIDSESQGEEQTLTDTKALLNEATANWDAGLDDDLDDSDEDEDEQNNDIQESTGMNIFVQREDPVINYVNKESIIAADFVSIGEFGQAKDKLAKQIGAQDIGCMKQCLFDIFMTSQFFESTFDFIQPRMHYITSESNDCAPYATNSLKLLETRLQTGFDLTTAGKPKFAEALKTFREIVLRIPLLSLTSKADEKIAKEILAIATQYIFALLCDSAIASAVPYIH